MTSSTTRSSRYSKKNTVDVTKNKTSSTIKKKKRTKYPSVDPEINQSQVSDNEQSTQEIQQDSLGECGGIDLSDHPEYIRLMSKLNSTKEDRLQKLENWRIHERQSIHDWYIAQKRQAWEEFISVRKKTRTDLIEEVQAKIVRLKQEYSLLASSQRQQRSLKNKHRLTIANWIPPDRLTSIGSFVGGASNDEIDRDLSHARQPYNGSNTPNLVYSDYESRSTTETTEDDDISTSRIDLAMNTQADHQQSPIYLDNTPTTAAATTTSYTNDNSNGAHTYRLDDIPQDGRFDWWSHRSSTTA
ncbi:hypothetical protein BDB01DRAFT_807986 [Pilobolus umbonatus]|nr:hypothetical protein BDB01DRAFT_807986 [Pilobolus umbonatus]